MPLLDYLSKVFILIINFNFMLYFIIAFLGCLLGYLIAKFTKEELKDGEIYFKILEFVILLILPLVLLSYSFNWVLLLVGLLFGVFFRFEYFYFGFSGLFRLESINFLGSALIFLYGFPYGSLVYYHKKWRLLIYSFVLFFLPLLFYFTDFNMSSFAAGGLLSLFVLKSPELVRKFYKLF